MGASGELALATEYASAIYHLIAIITIRLSFIVTLHLISYKFVVTFFTSNYYVNEAKTKSESTI